MMTTALRPDSAAPGRCRVLALDEAVGVSAVDAFHVVRPGEGGDGR